MQATARETAIATRLSIGPQDAGRRLTWEELRRADVQEGFRYELIDGRLTVLPVPEPAHDDVLDWLYGLLFDYSRAHPEVTNRISQAARIFIPNRPGETVPQPDLAAFHDYPRRRPKGMVFTWRLINPVLVVEVLSPNNHDKDVVRNVALYELVSSISEYWVVDALSGMDQVTMRVYRRRGAKWQKPIEVGPGEEYTTRLLPGFRLRLDPLT